VHEWAFFTDDETRTGGEYHADTLDEKGPFAQISVHDEARENRLDLRNA
jgi:hypothetical protein